MITNGPCHINQRQAETKAINGLETTKETLRDLRAFDMGHSALFVSVTSLVVIVTLAKLGHTSPSVSQSTWNRTAATLATLQQEQHSDIQEWTNGTERGGKFFPLFTLVRFSNEPCRTTNEENGICYTRSQCQALGGIAAGTCATRLGVCCQFFSSCGSIVNQNQTFFRNPDFPNKYRPPSGSDVCQIRIRRQINACQLRLNFLKFDIDGPNVAAASAMTNVGVEAGVCKNDMFTVTAAGSLAVCGNLDGQHMYFDFGSSDTITLNVLLGSSADREREWNVEMLMIPCRAPVRAPSGCLQYFQGLSGQVSSFNFNGGQHLANLGYTICVRSEEGMRSIDWSACNPGDVRITGPTTPPTTTPVTTPLPQTTCTTTNANNYDYFTIPGGVYYPLLASTTGTYPATLTSGQSFIDRFCDPFFATSLNFVRTTVKPFTISIKTDALELPSQTTTYSDASVGFCFKWQQSPNN